MVSCACWTNLVYPKIWSPSLETVTANSFPNPVCGLSFLHPVQMFLLQSFHWKHKAPLPTASCWPSPTMGSLLQLRVAAASGPPLPPWAFEVYLNWSFALSLPLLQPPAILLLSVQCTHYLYPNPRLVGRTQRPSAVLTICHSRCVFSLQGLSPASPFTGGLLPPCLVSSLLAFIFKPELQISHFSF